ncbi:MAG: hypothetical protein ACXW6R_20735 [Candidatus Binatia bacterium]
MTNLRLRDEKLEAVREAMNLSTDSAARSAVTDKSFLTLKQGGRSFGVP